MITKRPLARGTFAACIILAFLCGAAPQAFSLSSDPLGADDSPSGHESNPKPTNATAGETSELQKAVQNPIASLISVPIQNNSNFAIGPFDRKQNILNIQPVVPVRVSNDWNLIIRWIAPILWQPAPGTANLEVFGIEENTPAYLAAQNVKENAGVFGFGDMTPTFFFSPARPRRLIWGAGPVVILPAATNKLLGQGKFSLGPSVVVLIQPGRWTFGALVNNAWSVAGSGDRAAVNQMTLQYFVNYNLSYGWYLASSPILSANWKAVRENVWTVPLGGGAGRVFRLGSQPVNVSVQLFGNAARPSSGSIWSMRLQLAFLFPRGQ